MSAASRTWDSLRGILCIYKRPEVPLMTIASKIEERLLCDLNKSFLPMNMRHPSRYSSHPRVIGKEFYEAEDLRIQFLQDSARGDPRYSGLVLLALNQKEDELFLPKMDQRYLLDLRLGINTDTGFLREGVKILNRSDPPHPGALEKAVRSTLHSLGRDDILRIRLKSVSPREATLDISSKPLAMPFFLHFKDRLAQRIRSGVSIVRLRRYGIGPFELQNALLEKQLDLKNIIYNIKVNQDLLEKHAEKLRKDLKD